jgi:hypothetical protein
VTSIRRTGATSAATLFGIGTAVICTHLLAPNWTKAAGLDVWNVPSLRSQVESDTREGLGLSFEIEESRRRFVLKEQIIDSLLSEQISLKEATAQFLALNENHKPAMMVIRTTYKGATDEESTARNVISLAIPRMEGSLIDKAAILARLANEFDQFKSESDVISR